MGKHHIAGESVCIMVVRKKYIYNRFLKSNFIMKSYSGRL